MKYTKLTILLLTLIIFTGCTLGKSNQPVVIENPENTNAESMQNEEQEMAIDNQISETEMIKSLADNTDALIADLVDVSGGSSTGMAYILRLNGVEKRLQHSVTATLPELTNGNMYEGWLVKQKPELMFISTGVLEKNAEGIFTVEFSSTDLYEGYDFVVITEETIIDEKPEKHIIEGLVK
ncbi:MAG: hypothetical protein O2871_01280 [bacterium]|nr:hypothetical protein [bacterium]